MDKDVDNRNTVEYHQISNALKNIKMITHDYPDDSLALHTDLYQLNMAETYWDDKLHNRRAVFEAYYRKNPFGGGYVVFAGLERIIDYVANFRFSESDIDYLKNEVGYEDDLLDYLKTIRFDGNIRSVVEGEIIFPNEPIVQVDAKLAQAQLIETPILNALNFHSLIATKASRIRNAAGEDANIMEFGTRRAQEFDAALWGTRAAYIGGFNATSNMRAGKLFGMPVAGTHAHSTVQVYGDEYTAFKKFAKRHDNAVFLVDTYNTLKSGVPNAIKVANELEEGKVFLGIRIDSGDFTKLSKEARKMLDNAGYSKTGITLSGDLDEYVIEELKKNGAEFNGLGVGTKVITAYDQPALGMVYKLVSLEGEDGNMVDSIKLSENPEKTTTPGLKKVYRISRGLNSFPQADCITMADEDSKGANFIQLDDKCLTSFDARDIHKDIFKAGKLVYIQPSLEQMRAYCISNLRMLRNSFKAITNPEKYKVVLSEKCKDNKERNIETAMSRF